MLSCCLVMIVLVKPSEQAAAVQRMETCLASVRKWMCHKSLKLNDKKTEMLLISTKQLATKLNCHTLLLIGEHQVTPATVVRNIGVIMDTHASKEAQVNNVSRAAYYLYNIGRIRCYLSQSAAEQLVHAFVTSKLDYCNGATLWFTISTDTEAAAHPKRSSTHRYSHQQIGPHHAVLFALHWLPVCQRIKFKVLVIVFKAKCGTGPVYLQELIQPYRRGRELRSANHHLLNVPFTKSAAISNRAFGVAGPVLWNGLPRYIRAITTLTVFKSQLKTHLFTE